MVSRMLQRIDTFRLEQVLERPSMNLFDQLMLIIKGYTIGLLIILVCALIGLLEELKE